MYFKNSIKIYVKKCFMNVITKIQNYQQNDIYKYFFKMQIFETTLYLRNYDRYRYAVFDIKFLLKKKPSETDIHYC